MSPAPTWVFSALISLLCLKSVIAGGDDDAQVVFGQDESMDESTIIEELSDLLQSSIWLEQNATDSSEVASHCVRAKTLELD